MNFREQYERWINSNVISDEMKNEVRNITDEKELED